MEIAYFAGGCFWCTEAIFQRLKGVTKVISGYTGGTVEEPSYQEVSAGTSGHAEAIKIEFDPAEISYEDLLSVFFATHDPTTLNRQGADTGTQYRSAIFYATESQKLKAQSYISKLENEKKYSSPIVTKLGKFEKFYEVEPYHKEYYNRNNDAMYCQIVIDPKIQKLYKEFGGMVKEK